MGFSEPVTFPSDYDLDVPTYTGEPSYDPTAPHCYLDGIPTECGQALRLISQGMANVDPTRTNWSSAGRLGLQPNWQFVEDGSFYKRTLLTDEYNPDGTLYGRAGEERMVLATNSHWEFKGYEVFGSVRYIGAISGEPVFRQGVFQSKRPVTSAKGKKEERPKEKLLETDDAGRKCKKEEMELVKLWNWTGSGIPHTFIETPDRTVGFYPKWNRWPTSPRKIEDDSSHPRDKEPVRIYKACPESLRILEQKIDDNASNLYNVTNGLGMNCTSFACRRLKEAGFTPPSKWWVPLTNPWTNK
ncbi:MAG: hypothetical protein U0Z53_05085 [Blastocatellia bacterium]